MSFTLAMGSNQSVDGMISADHGDEILLFGRALEIVDIELTYQHQLSLPLFPPHETVHCVQ
jgi:hypothetical protein